MVSSHDHLVLAKASNMHPVFVLPMSEVVDCGHPGSPPNGVLSGDKFTFGSTVRYSCLGGRQLKGESSRMCQLNGMWSAPMPFCSGKPITFITAKAMERWMGDVAGCGCVEHFLQLTDSFSEAFWDNRDGQTR